jgi:hypothetical protein
MQNMYGNLSPDLGLLVLSVIFLMVGMAKGTSKNNTQKAATKKAAPAPAVTLEKTQCRIVTPDADLAKKFKAALQGVAKSLKAGTALQEKSVRDAALVAHKMVHSLLQVVGDWKDGHLVASVQHPLYPSYILDWDGTNYWWRYVSAIDNGVATMTASWVKDPYGKQTPAQKAAKQDKMVAFAFGFQAHTMPDNSTQYLCPNTDCGQWVVSPAGHKCYREGVLTMVGEASAEGSEETQG